MPAPLRFQHFEVLTRPDGTPHVLGKGSMGVTYKAFDRNLHSIVVIKVINPRYVSDPTARRRFVKEAQAMARIRHPNVANVFHFGETDRDVFYAMEFCDGPNLDEFVRNGKPLEPVAALLLMKQAAGALQAIDKSGLVHRDIKPSNIILTTDVQGGTQLKLIDFGLARGEHGDKDIDPDLTRGGFVGTPGYASPEQLLEQEDLDIRSDIYSLGGTFWYALTGSPVFKGSHVEVMFHHVNSPPPWEQLPPLPSGVRGVLEQMLGKSREDRYQSSTSLWDSIEECIRNGHLAEPGATPHLQLQAARKPTEAAIVGHSNYEILADLGEVREGKLFRARDIVSGSTVALRYLRQDLIEKPGLLPALKAAVANLQVAEHPNHVRVHDLLEGDDGIQLVTEWVEGPTLLQLLKSRERPVLRDLIPLLVQLAGAFDHAIRHHIATCESEPHQITIRPGEGTDSSDYSRFLRSSAGEGSGFQLKLNPLGLSFAPSDYAAKLPGEVALVLFKDFLRLLHLLLGGVSGTQTHGHGYYTTLPSLGAPGNEVLEKHFGSVVPGGAASPEGKALAEGAAVPCRTVLTELAAAENLQVEWPAEPEPELPAEPDAGMEPGIDQTMVSGVRYSSVPPASQIAASAPGRAGSMAGGMHASTPGSTMGSRAWSASQSSSGSVFQRRQELERQRREFEARISQLPQHEVLETERNLLAQERGLLEKQREELLVRERERAHAAEREKNRLEEERRRLESRGSELEVKRSEQERLAQELQLRTQLEFQKLQDEKLKLEREWESRRLKTEALLRDKEEQFLLNEQRSLRRIQEEREKLDQNYRDIESRREEARIQTSAVIEGEELELRRERDALLARQRELESELQQRDHALVQAREELRAAVDAFEARRVAFEGERASLAAAAERERQEAVASIDAERDQLRDALAELERQRNEEVDNLTRQIAAANTEQEREALEARAAAERNRIAAAERAVHERGAQLESQLAEVEASVRAKEEAIAARQQELDAEWRKLEQSKHEARQALGMEIDAERQAVVKERELLAEQAARLESEAAARQSERERNAAAEKAELERQRADIAAQRNALAAEQAALRAGLESEKNALLRAEESRRKEEEETHRQQLVARARELSSLEDDKSARLESLQKEIADVERQLSSQREELFKQERVNEAVLRKATRQDEALLTQIQAEQTRMDQQRAELDAKLAEFKRAQKKRLIAIACGIVVAVIAAYYLTTLIQLLINPTLGEKQAWDALTTERQQFRSQKAWPELLQSSVKTIDRFTNVEEFRNKETGKIDTDAQNRYADYFKSHRPELEADLRAALDGLATSWTKEMAGNKEAVTNLLRSLDRVQDWGLSSQTSVLRALIGMPEQRAQNDFAAAFTAYFAAVQKDPAHADTLGEELRATVDAALSAFRNSRKVSRATELSDALNQLPAEQSAKIPSVQALITELRAETARSQGNYTEAATILLARPPAEWAAFDPSLKIVVSEGAQSGYAKLAPLLQEIARAQRANPDNTILNPLLGVLAVAAMENPPTDPLQVLRLLLDGVPNSASRAGEFTPHLGKIFGMIRGLPPATLSDSATRSLLVQTGDTWKSAEPYLILAATEPAAQQRFDFYRKAHEFGSLEGTAHAGRFFYGYGVENNSLEDAEQGKQMMDKAAAGGNATALYLLGEIYFAGIGVPPDHEAAIQFARKARAAGHAKAILLEGQAQLRKAETDKSAAAYDETRKTLTSAVEAGIEDARYYLYIAWWNPNNHDAAQAAAVLRAGAAANNANCLHALATWEEKGNPPIEQNLSSAREHYAQAARAGHPGARKWCAEYALRLTATATPADKAWLEKNADVCRP